MAGAAPACEKVLSVSDRWPARFLVAAGPRFLAELEEARAVNRSTTVAVDLLSGEVAPRLRRAEKKRRPLARHCASFLRCSRALSRSRREVVARSALAPRAGDA